MKKSKKQTATLRIIVNNSIKKEEEIELAMKNITYWKVFEFQR